LKTKTSCFVDTTAWIAVTCASDINHAAASRHFAEVLNSGIILFTTRFVFAETVIFIRKKVSIDAAIQLGEHLLHSPQVKVVQTTTQIHEQAWTLFRKYRDWRDLSYVDCLSFMVMKNIGIDIAFSFDDDFRRFGFQRLP